MCVCVCACVCVCVSMCVLTFNSSSRKLSRISLSFLFFRHHNHEMCDQRSIVCNMCAYVPVAKPSEHIFTLFTASLCRCRFQTAATSFFAL